MKKKSLYIVFQILWRLPSIIGSNCSVSKIILIIVTFPTRQSRRRGALGDIERCYKG